MTDQKPNCHNCRTYGTPQCPDCGGRKYDTLCIEHPRLREWLMRDVVKELDRITTLELTEKQECYIDGIREAIDLIKEGV